jgi:hypothetical protein
MTIYDGLDPSMADGNSAAYIGLLQKYFVVFFITQVTVLSPIFNVC